MSQPEYRLAAKIIKKITERGGWCFKVHGSASQRAGVPDILGCYQGRAFGIEVKLPGEEHTVSARQSYEHERMRKADAVVMVATTVEQVAALLDILEGIDG